MRGLNKYVAAAGSKISCRVYEYELLRRRRLDRKDRVGAGSAEQTRDRDLECAADFSCPYGERRAAGACRYGDGRRKGQNIVRIVAGQLDHRSARGRSSR